MTDVTEDVALGEVNATEMNGDNGGLPAGLPMPRDPDLLATRLGGSGSRPSTGGRYPFPVPNGWFVVAESAGSAPARCGDPLLRPRPRAVPGGRRRARGSSTPTAPTSAPTSRSAAGSRAAASAARSTAGASTAPGRVRRDPLRRRDPDPAEGPCPRLPDRRAQPHDLGLVPRHGRRARSTTCRWCPSSTTTTGRPSSSATSRSGSPPRTWPRTTWTSRTSATSTGPRSSPRTSSSPRARTSGPRRRTGSSARATASGSACCG